MWKSISGILLGCLMTMAGCATMDETNKMDSDSGSDEGQSSDKGSDSVKDTDSDVDSGLQQKALNSMTWITVEPGNFKMGTPGSEFRRDGDELPHEVTQIHRYAILSTEVTCEQWTALPTGFEDMCKAKTCDEADLNCVPICDQADCPVPDMTLNAAMAWLDALSEAQGLTPCYKNAAAFETPIHCPGYRLPTEAEWERAARAGDNRATYNGGFTSEETSEDVFAPIAWCGNSGMSQSDRRARPVAQGEPNAWGLYDMIGNLVELTTWDGHYSDNTPQSPYGRLDTGFLGERGGSFNTFYHSFHSCRAGSRQRVNPQYTSSDVGLRPVRTLDGGQLPLVQQTNWCPLPRPIEDCPQPEDAAFEFHHRYSDDAVYIDMAAGSPIAFLGESPATGPFVETGEIVNWGEFSTSAHFLENNSDTLHGTRIAHTRYWDVEPEIAFMVILCDSANDTCVLHKLDGGASAVIKPVANGTLPPWIGNAPHLLVFTEPLEVYAAGNGIAVFNGETWQQVAAAEEGIVYHGIDGYQRDNVSHVMVVGDGGQIRLHDENGWGSVQTSVTEDLHSVHFGNDINGIGPFLTITGNGGTVLTGLATEFSTCVIESENWMDAVGAANSAEFIWPLISEAGVALEASIDYTNPGGPLFCRQTNLPKNRITSAVTRCGVADNILHLAEDGVYAEGLFCAIE